MKTIIVITALIWSVSLLSAREITLPAFGDVKGGISGGWVLNKGKLFTPLGSLKTETQDGSVVVSISSQAKPTNIYTKKTYSAKNGDRYEIEYDAKGTGDIGVGIYMYQKDGWLGAACRLEGAISDWTTRKVIIEVKDKVNKKLAKVRFVLLANANASGKFKNLKIKKLD